LCEAGGIQSIVVPSTPNVPFWNLSDLPIVNVLDFWLKARSCTVLLEHLCWLHQYLISIHYYNLAFCLLFDHLPSFVKCYKSGFPRFK
jgi:hypothetical protein